MDTLILVSVFGDCKGNNRASSILQRMDANALFVTTNYNHGEKRYKTMDEMKGTYCLEVPVYKTNLSLRRIYSHIIFAYKLKRFLNSLQQTPSVIYCAMPTSTAAYVCGKYCKKHGVKFVIDVIDLWPDSLMPIVGGMKGGQYLVSPWKHITVSAYKMADVILGESKQYVNEAALYNSKALVYPLYLGIDKRMVKKLIAESELVLNKLANEMWIGYAGSLGTSYDFETLIKGVAVLNGKYQYKLIFIGDGVCRAEIEKLILQYSVNAEITGFLEYGNLLKYLSYCDIAVNIFRNNTKVVHSYKFNDYVATNCFVLNSLSGETADMINQYQIGLNFDFRENTFDKVLLQCIELWDEYKEWKNNNERLVNEILDKEKIYSKIENILSSLK